jgi:hypothetical protein
MPDQDLRKEERISRREQRIPRSEPVLLSALGQHSRGEPTRTQNISPSGARVFTQRVWEPGSRVVIKSLRGDFLAQARVVYWRSFSSSTFAVGLEFKAGRGEWPSNN